MKSFLKYGFISLLVFVMMLSLAVNVVAVEADEENDEEAVLYTTGEKPVFTSAEELIEALPHVDPELAPLFLEADEEQEPPPINSNQKIQLAREAGELSREEAAVLSVLAAYDNGELPEKYRSSEPSTSAQFDIKYLYDNWDSLSEEAKEAVIPYLVPINDPRSIYNPESETGEETALFNFNLIPRAQAVINIFDINIHEFSHDGRKITIMYFGETTWSEEQKQLYKDMMKTVEKAIKHSWDEFKPLMKTGLSHDLFVEFIHYYDEPDINGEEFFDNSHYRIRLNKKLVKKKEKVKSVTAHELFHCFQDEYNMGFDMTDEKWLSEATATWSQNYAYSDNNIEHEYLLEFFDTLQKERIYFNESFEYASYMLFYYLTDYGGAKIIQQSIANAGQNGNNSIRPFLEKNIPNLKDNYGKFALHNWNNTPYIKYNDNGPLNYTPSGLGVESTIMPADTHDEKTVSLEKGAITYYTYAFDQDDPKLQHVILSFDSPIDSDKHVKRQIMLKINGEWHIEDISSETYREYCARRQSAEERVDMLVLVYSNASFTEKKDKIDKYEIRVEGCPKEMELTMKVEYHYAFQDWNYSSESQLTETLEIVDHCLFLVKDSEYQASGEGYLEGKKVLTGDASYNITIEEPDYKNSLARILKRTEGNIKGTEEAYAKFGIEDRIPPEGIFVTLPAALEEDTLKGRGTFYLPEPVGNMSFDMPLVIDGIGQLISFYPHKIGDWHPTGIKIAREFNPYQHKTAITEAFTVDNKKLMSELEEMGSMPEMPDMPDMPDMDMGDMELPDEVKSAMGDSDGYMSDFHTIIGALYPSEDLSGIEARLKLRIIGEYTEYYED